MNAESEIAIGRRINDALEALREAHFRMGMSGQWHIGKARDIADDNSLIERHVQPLDESEEAQYLDSLRELIINTESQDRRCAELWTGNSIDSPARFEQERAALCSLFIQFKFTLRSYERTLRQSEKPYLDQARDLSDEAPDHPSLKAIEGRLRLRIREFIDLEASIAESLQRLDTARTELVDAHRDFAIQFADDTGLSRKAAIDCALYGVRKAAEYFDYTRGYRFATYAENWIEQAIKIRRSE